LSAGHFLDLDHWPRRGIYQLFRTYEQPFFSITAEVAVTRTRHWCAEQEQPFGLACWYMVLRAVNAVEEFRHRLRPEGVWVHHRLRVSATVPGEGGAFRFCHFPDATDFPAFLAGAREAMAAPDPTGGAALDDRPHDDATIHGSVLPWIRFTGVVNPRRHDPLDSVPKIVLGRCTAGPQELIIPIAVDAHHALVDGRHVAHLLEQLTVDFARPEEVLHD